METLQVTEIQLPVLYNKLYPIIAKWEEFGRLLGVNSNTIRNIQASNQTVEPRVKMMMVLEKIRKINPNLQWREIEEALKSIQNFSLASKVPSSGEVTCSNDQLLEFLEDEIHNWWRFGSQMRVSPTDLTCMDNKDSVEVCFEKLMVCWVKQLGENATFSKILMACQKMGDNTLFVELKTDKEIQESFSTAPKKENMLQPPEESFINIRERVPRRLSDVKARSIINCFICLFSIVILIALAPVLTDPSLYLSKFPLKAVIILSPYVSESKNGMMEYSESLLSPSATECPNDKIKYSELLLLPNTTECQNNIMEYSNSLLISYTENDVTYDKLDFQSFSQYYTPLVIVKRETINKSETKNITLLTLCGCGPDIIPSKIESQNLTNIFEPVSEKRLKLILITGPPGIGKSTLALEIARNWRQLSNYSLAILVRLREQKSQTATLIDHLYIDRPSLNKVKECNVRADGKGILWILDGFDELPIKQHQNNSDSVYHQLLQKNILPLSTVVVTSRPSSIKYLQKYLYPKQSKHLEVLGFGEKELANYSKQVFEDEHMLSKFTNFYKNSMIHSLMKVPINAVMFTYIFKSTPSKQYPTTSTELYSTFACCLLRRYNPSIPNYCRLITTEDIKKLPDPLQPKIQYLLKIAYDGLVHGKLFFYDTDLENVSSFDHLGLMNEVISSSHSAGSEHAYNFLHITLQEYLAAMYLVQHPKIITSVLLQHKQLATFFFGIYSGQMSASKQWSLDDRALQYAFHYYSSQHDDGYTPEDLLYILYEFPKIGTNFTFIHSRFLSNSAMFIAGYLIAHSKFSPISVTLDFLMPDDQTHMFVEGLMSDVNINDDLDGSGFTNYLQLNYHCSYGDSDTRLPLDIQDAIHVTEQLFDSCKSRFKVEVLCFVFHNFVRNEVIDLTPKNSFKLIILWLLSLIPNETAHSDIKFFLEKRVANRIVFDEQLFFFYDSTLSSPRFIIPSDMILNEQIILKRCKISMELVQTLLTTQPKMTHLEISAENRNLQSNIYGKIMNILLTNSSLIILGIPILESSTHYEFLPLYNNRNLRVLKLYLTESSVGTPYLLSAITSQANFIVHLDIVLRYEFSDYFCSYLYQLIWASTFPLQQVNFITENSLTYEFKPNFKRQFCSIKCLMSLLEAAKSKKYRFLIGLPDIITSSKEMIKIIKQSPHHVVLLATYWHKTPLKEENVSISEHTRNSTLSNY